MNTSKPRRAYSMLFVMMLIISLVVLITSAIFTVLLVYYRTEDFKQSADARLLMADELTREILGSNYHDHIVDETSLSKEQFRRIVARNDDICRRLNLQYLWSVLLVKDKLVFTSATHSDLNDSTSPCASFFETHRDPEAFALALQQELKPVYSSFRNEWGEGRQVQIARKDARGRTYIFGASLQLTALNAMVRRTAMASLGISLGVIFAAFFIALLLSRIFVVPIARLTEAADRMDIGNLDVLLPSGGMREVQSFASSLNKMRTGLKTQLALQRESEGKYRELVENANSIILRRKADGEITFFNEFAEKFFGFSKNELLGQSVLGTIVPEKDSTSRDLRAMVFDIARNPEKYEKNENENMCKDGSRVWISWSNKAIFDAAGTVSEILCVGNDITRRKQAEDALRQSEKEFRTLTEAMPQIVWATRKDGWNIYFNQQWVDYTGLTLEQSYGHGWNIPFHPDDQQRAWNAWENATKNTGVYSIECRLRRADGEYFWWLIRGVPFRDEKGEIIKWFGTCTDIDSLKRAEDALSRNEEILRQAQEIAHLGSWELDLVANRLVWSDEVYRIFGLQVEEFGGNHEAFVAAVHPEDRAAVSKAYFDSIKNGLDSYEVVHRVVRKNTGEIRYVHERCRHFRDAAGSVVRSVGMVHDITERKVDEEALQVKNDELIRFNYTVSHDLKSPLVTIKTFLGYLVQDMAKADTEHVAQDLAYIHTAADRMNAMLEELLDLSRIGLVFNPPVEAPLQELVREALDLVAGRINRRGVQVVVSQEPIMLYGDRLRLVEVFQNLVDNAVKFMGDQREPLIEIGAEAKQNEIVCFVRDNGMGLDPQHKNKLFGLFEKLNPDIEGTGLGLALVKRIVEVHGGRIWVESEGLGKGACFWLTLPGKGTVQG